MAIADYDVTVVKRLTVAPGRQPQQVASVVRVYYARSKKTAMRLAKIHGRPISACRLS